MDWVPATCSGQINLLWKVVLTHFVANRTAFIPKSSTVDDFGLIVRSPDALRPLTLCNCDCKIITTAICFGRCIHPAQRCVSTRQMTDDIFKVETTALAHFACATRDSGVLLTDFACAYLVSITPGSSTFSKRQNCPRLSDNSCVCSTAIA